MWKRSRIAVVGTGAVGREVLGALESRDVPSEWITVYGSERTVGEELEYADDTLEVEALDEDAFRGMNVVFLAVPVGEVRLLAVRAQEAGAWVIDVSPSYREDTQIPLVLPALGGPVERPKSGRILATPSPVTTALALLLAPLREDVGVEHVSVTALLGASSAGRAGIRELETTTANLLSGKDAEPVAFPHRLAFNIVPQVGPVSPEGVTAEERSWGQELSRLTAGWRHRPTVSGTAMLVPTFYGHVLSLELELAGAASLESLRKRWSAAPHLKVLDDAAERVYPMPMLVGADPSVHLGRIRQVAGRPNRVSLVAALDNAGRGAAISAVEVAEALIGEA